MIHPGDTMERLVGGKRGAAPRGGAADAGRRMKLYKTYSGGNFPKTYLVMERDEQPEKIVPFNILYIFGTLKLIKGALMPSHLPFSKGGQRRIAEVVDEAGYCFYKWPGKILGMELGDILEVDDDTPKD